MTAWAGLLLLLKGLVQGIILGLLGVRRVVRVRVMLMSALSVGRLVSCCCVTAAHVPSTWGVWG
jgi:hypothetical protein